MRKFFVFVFFCGFFTASWAQAEIQASNKQIVCKESGYTKVTHNLCKQSKANLERLISCNALAKTDFAYGLCVATNLSMEDYFVCQGWHLDPKSEEYHPLYSQLCLIEKALIAQNKIVPKKQEDVLLAAKDLTSYEVELRDAYSSEPTIIVPQGDLSGEELERLLEEQLNKEPRKAKILQFKIIDLGEDI